MSDPKNSPAAMRAKIAASTGKPAPVPPKPAAPEPLKYGCGHEQSAKRAAETDCPACRQTKHEAAMRKALGRKAKRDRTIGKSEKDGRLPHLSTFLVQYDAEKTEWHGVLTMPGDAKFKGNHSAVEKLLRDLARQYRESLTPENPPTVLDDAKPAE